METKSKVNATSIMLFLLTGSVAVAGWGLTHAYESLEKGQQELRIEIRELKSTIMPRTEIELEVTSVREKQKSSDSDIQDLRNRVTKMQFELKKP